MSEEDRKKLSERSIKYYNENKKISYEKERAL